MSQADILYQLCKDRAFPVVIDRGHTLLVAGLTKKEWYAGLAMQGILSSRKEGTTPETASTLAFMVAEAMLVEAEKQNKVG